MYNNRKSIKIVLLGRTGGGKSALGNRILGKSVFIEGNTLVSETSTTVSKIADIGDLYRVEIIDTPGFADNRPDMTTEQLLANILSFLKGLEGGFNIGIYCISAKNRVDANDINEFRLIGTLLGQAVFRHTFIAVTQANTLQQETRRKVYSNFTISFPSLLEGHGIFGIGPDRILFADFDNFQEKFMVPLTRIMETSSVYCPRIAQEIDVNDPLSIKKFLMTPEMQEFMERYEDQLKEKSQEIEKLKMLMVKNAEESQRQIQRHSEELLICKNNLEAVNEQLLSSQKMSQELRQSYTAYHDQQAAEIQKLTADLQKQEQNQSNYIQQMKMREMDFLTLDNRIQELLRLRQDANSTPNSKFWVSAVDNLGKIVKKAIPLYFEYLKTTTSDDFY